MSWLKKYYEDCKRRKTLINDEEVLLLIGEEMMMELDNLITDLDNPEYRYDTTKSDTMIDFMENCIRLTKSPYYNQPMKLMLWQKAFIECLYSFKIYDKHLNKWVDRFTESLLLIGRKNTKSETCSAICDTEMCIGGEGMDIITASNTYDQASILFEACDTMRMLIDPTNTDTWRNRQGLTCLYNNNKIRTLSERTRNKEGKNIDIAVVDEVHEMQDDSLINPIVQSMSNKENKKVIKITTEGFTYDSYLDKDLIKYRKIIAGEDTSISAKRCLPWLYTQDSEAEVWNTDDNDISQVWQKSNPTLIYGIKKWSYLRDQVDEARKDKTKRIFVLCKDFNFKMSNNGQAWLMKEEYDYESSFNIEDFRNYYCFGSVDLAETTDLVSAKMMLIKKSDPSIKYILSHYWIPESKLENSPDTQAGAKYRDWANDELITICSGNDADLSSVADWFYSFQEKYGIRLFKCGYDQRFKNEWINRMNYYGWEDKTDLIMINQSPDILHTPIKQVEADLKTKKIIGLNEVDKWCLGNAALKVNNQERAILCKVDGMASKRKDGADTLVFVQEIYNRFKSELLDYLPD